ncbi:hypothetical protein [Shewanella algae]|uniref:hypothetical protein n=1 Tax=Shewanella algae TaxID=38313 RepID=UPI001AACC6CA|nr:hypothetical protein [Shewanella algae]QTE83270.1 hypothetical protein JKK46_05030 [Shewanella algae]
MNFEIGRTYYHLTFADKYLSMPALEPLVFVGRNVFEGEVDTYSFQDTVSYVRFGAFGEGEPEAGDVLITSFGSDQLSAIITLEQVHQEIANALRRYAENNEPKLKKLRGKWVTLNPNKSM